MLLNYGVGEDSCESLGLQGDQTSPSQRKSVLNIHWKDGGWGWTSMLWLPDAKSWLIWKDPDAGKDWRQEKKGMTQDEMVGWHHRLDGHEFEQALGDGDGQGGLACCKGPRGWKCWTQLTDVHFHFQYSILWMGNRVCSHSSIEWHLGYFHISAIMKKAAINTRVWVFLWT